MTKQTVRKRRTTKRRGSQAFLESRLKLSAISLRDATYAGIRAMSVEEAHCLGIGLPPYCTDGFLIRYPDLDGNEIPSQWRWRNDPAKTRGFAAITKEMLRGKRKYVQPKGTGCFLYFPKVKSLNWREVLADPSKQVALVEGELKSAVAMFGRNISYRHRGSMELAKQC